MFCCSSGTFSPASIPAAAAARPRAPLASSSSLLFNRASFSPAAGRAVSVSRPSGRRARRVGAIRCLFGLGVPELAVIAGVAALVFGPKQLPEVGKNFGKTIKSFQQAAKEFEAELKKAPEEDAQTLPPPEAPKAVSSEGEKKELEALSTKESS